MQYYRLYFLDDDGHIRHAVELECKGDDEAIALIDSHADGRTLELWSRDRLVRRFDAREQKGPLMNLQGLFLTADGRIGRKDFWIAFVAIVAASLLLNFAPVLGHLIGLLLIWPQVCIHTKRLHDMGHTGWLQLIPFVAGAVCIVGAVLTGGVALITAMVAAGSGDNGVSAAAAMAGMGLAFAILGVALLIGFAFLLWVGLSPPQQGENAYGPPPQSLTGGGGA